MRSGPDATVSDRADQRFLVPRRVQRPAAGSPGEPAAASCRPGGIPLAIFSREIPRASLGRPPGIQDQRGAESGHACDPIRSESRQGSILTVRRKAAQDLPSGIPRPARRPGVRDLSLEVRRGEIFALLGHNGAGKTTTLKAVLGLVRPDRGRITIDGVAAAAPSHAWGGLPARGPTSTRTSPRASCSTSTASCSASRATASRAGHGLPRTGRHGRARRPPPRRAARRACASAWAWRRRCSATRAADPRRAAVGPRSAGPPPGARPAARLRARAAPSSSPRTSCPTSPAVADRVATLREGRLVEVRDLSQRPAARTFRVVVAAPAADGQRRCCAATSAHPAPHDPTAGPSTSPTARPVRALDACDEWGLAVHDVAPDVGDVEAAVLAGLGPAPEAPAAGGAVMLTRTLAVAGAPSARPSATASSTWWGPSAWPSWAPPWCSRP